MTGWDELGGNPTPGDVGALRAHARQLSGVSDNGRDVEQRLRELHTGMGQLRWQGAGADGIAGIVADTLPGLVTFWSAYGDAGRALVRLADELDGLQARANAAGTSFTDATASARAADASSADAGGRHDAAQRSVDWLDLEIGGVEARRLVALAAHQSTAGLDRELADLRHQRSYQSGLRDAANADRAAAGARLAAANGQIAQAKQLIEQLRQEAGDAGKLAAAAVLAAIGVVHSGNPLVRAWDDAVHDADVGLKWFSDNALDATDQLLGRLAILALVIAPIPVLDFLDVPLAGVMTGLGALSAIGHLYRAANGEESPWHAGAAVIEAIPIGRALGELSHVRPEEFRSLPGIVKRLASFDDATHAKGWLSSSGVRVFGRVLYRAHVVPKPVGPIVLTRGLLVARATQIVVKELDKGQQDLHHLEHAVGFGHRDDPPPTKEEQAEQVLTILLQHAVPAADSARK